MATIETAWLGDLRSEARHIQSGATLITDAPTDNHGKGESFSPTDLVATALGSCMATLMELAAAPRGLDIRGMRAEITKVMAADPRRIGEIIIDFHFPGDYSDRDRKILENAAHTCPVSKSLHPDLKQTIAFHYGGK